MNEEQDKTLCAKYPNLYRDRNESMYSTCMCWGFSCGPGWYNIIDELSAKLEAEIVLLKEGFEGDPSNLPAAAQVKEKFGGLRFYMTSSTDTMQKAIADAEDKSYLTCEDCGEEGKERTDRGWIRTLCEKCNKERK